METNKIKTILEGTKVDTVIWRAVASENSRKWEDQLTVLFTQRKRFSF